MVTKQTLRIYEGDSDTLNLTIGDGSTDITNYIVYFTVKADIDDADAAAIINKDITTHSNPTIGETKIPILPVDTAGQSPGDYVYDIRYDDGTGAIFTILNGTFKITQAVGDLVD